MISLTGLISQKAFGKFEMGKVVSNPFATAFIKEGEGEDHEVSMANNSLDTIIKMATELKAKMGEDEKQIPAWIQDHIAKAENLISQASSNYHEYGDSNEAMNEEPAKSTGEKIQNLNNRIKALKDKMGATKSSEQKNLIQQRLKNALQTLSNYKKQNISKESVNEGVGREAIAIAGFTGTRGIAVQKFIDDFNLNAKNLFNFIAKGKEKVRKDFATAMSGRPGNKYQGDFVGMFGESTMQEKLSRFPGGKEYPTFGNPLEGFPTQYKELLKKLQRSNDRSERHMLINKMNVIRKKLNLIPLTNEDIVNEEGPCWQGYKQVGMKDKGGRQVPNCVPNK